MITENLPQYFYIIFKKHWLVGLTGLIDGLSSSLVAIPSGLLADRFSRSKLLRFAALLGLLTTASFFLMVTFHKAVPLLVIALVLSGAYASFTNVSLESLFADSVMTGNRSFIYAMKQLVKYVPRMTGPMVTAFIFLGLGNKWQLAHLKIVLYVGISLRVVPTILLLFFSDAKALGAESEAVSESAASAKDTKKALEPAGQADAAGSIQGGAGGPEEAEEEEPLLGTPQWSRCRRAVWRLTPLWIAGSDVVVSLGAGMTVKFFPIYFQRAGFSPVAWNFLTAGGNISVALSALLAQLASRKLGRVATIFLCRLIASGCLLAMSLLTKHLGATAPLFVIRVALMRSAYPLERSILMDVVSKKHRGKMNAVESITVMSWSGSAFLGGLLIDHGSYELCFFITSLVYFAATALLAPLFLVVPRTEAAWRRRLAEHARMVEEEAKQGKGLT